MKKMVISLFLGLGLLFLTTLEPLDVSIKALPGEQAKFFSPQNGDNLEDTLIHAIREAKQSIHLATYSLKSAKIIQALNEAAQSGISVLIVFDATASLNIEKKLTPKIHAIPRKLKGLMHLKLLVIDNHETWLGSANITRDSLKFHANLITHMDSPEFANAVLLKIRELSSDHYEQPIPPQFFKQGDQTIELRFLPDDETALGRLKELIREAKHSIRVAMFTFTREDLADTLIRAKKRGVRVEVIMDLNSSNGASKKIADLLLRNNISLEFKNTGGLMHHKFMWIDEEILVHGSANWTKAAFKQNDDYLMIINPLNKEQKKVLYTIWNQFFGFFKSA